MRTDRPPGWVLDVVRGDPTLATYGFLPAACADFLRRLGRTADARAAYEQALQLTANEVEREFLLRRLEEL